MIIVAVMLSYPGFDEETTGVYYNVCRADRPITIRRGHVKVDVPHTHCDKSLYIIIGVYSTMRARHNNIDITRHL